MQTFKTWLNEGETKNRTLTLYHGVKNPDNVKKILAGGFKLIYIKPRWQNDYAVSAAKSKKGVETFFGRREVIILKFKFKGAIWKGDKWDNLGNETGASFANSPQNYTRDIIRSGIDAADQGAHVFIYNPKKIFNIEIV